MNLVDMNVFIVVINFPLLHLPLYLQHLRNTLNGGSTSSTSRNKSNDSISTRRRYFLSFIVEVEVLRLVFSCRLLSFVPVYMTYIS